MNKTEHVAFRWLERQGHKDIVFSGRDTPDFHTNRGQYEVKRLHGNMVVLTEGQRAKILAAKAKVLVFKDDNKAPVAVLEPGEVQIERVKGFRVLVSPRSKTLSFALETEKLVNDYRKAQETIPTLSEAINTLILLGLERTKKNLGEK